MDSEEDFIKMERWMSPLKFGTSDALNGRVNHNPGLKLGNSISMYRQCNAGHSLNTLSKLRLKSIQALMARHRDLAVPTRKDWIASTTRA
jgi:hypothetical protein